MKAKKVHPPPPDVRLAGSFEGNSKNLGDCRQIDYTHMWERYLHLYQGAYTEHELRRMHQFWKRIAAQS